jgi:hypothetical protein
LGGVLAALIRCSISASRAEPTGSGDGNDEGEDGEGARCLKVWPELLMPKGVKKPTAGAGVNAAQLGTVTRRGHTLQVTSSGAPPIGSSTTAPGSGEREHHRQVGQMVGGRADETSRISPEHGFVRSSEHHDVTHPAIVPHKRLGQCEREPVAQPDAGADPTRAATDATDHPTDPH